MQCLLEHDRRLGVSSLFPERLRHDPLDRSEDERAIVRSVVDEHFRSLSSIEGSSIFAQLK